jgi:protein-S-isoprenylcysteine O-methyltransferase Ste14
MRLYIKGLLFSILIPGTVAGYIPYRLTKDRLHDLNLETIHWLGLPVMCVGIIVYLWTITSFLLRGKGTPAIWFTGALHWLIGKEPARLVSSGLYKYSRNPMYLGVMITVSGEALFFQQSVLLRYLLLLLVIFYLVVVVIEEPHLEQKFGEEYKTYRKKVRRWL